MAVSKVPLHIDCLCFGCLAHVKSPLGSCSCFTLFQPQLSRVYDFVRVCGFKLAPQFERSFADEIFFLLLGRCSACFTSQSGTRCVSSAAFGQVSYTGHFIFDHFIVLLMP